MQTKTKEQYVKKMESRNSKTNKKDKKNLIPSLMTKIKDLEGKLGTRLYNIKNLEKVETEYGLLNRKYESLLKNFKRLDKKSDSQIHLIKELNAEIRKVKQDAKQQP